ncbi:MAG: phage holin family protein [Propionibacteriaceae bacterium]|nr:phage holin family protein [Propionibacteriaceae bacterium]
MPILIQTIVNAVALLVLDWLLSSVTVLKGDGGTIVTILVYLVVGLLVALVNSIIKPFIKLLALPLYILTLGLFGLIVNGLMLFLVTKLTPVLGFGLEVTSFGAAIWAGLLLSILTAIISIPFRNRTDEQ